MCNPRRIRVQATRVLAERWQQEVDRRVALSGEASGEARMTEPLGARIGTPTLTALIRVLAHTDGWEQRDDGFRHALPGGYVAYHPATRELEIVARVDATVHVVGEVSEVVEGGITEVIEREGVGVHYDDNWGGITEEDARREAVRNANAAADAASRERLAQARQEFEEEALRRADAAAQARAEALLAEARSTRDAELTRSARDTLTAVGVQGRNLFHAALASAYRDAILAYARSHDAEGISCTEQDGVVEIEFEMSA